MGRCRFETLGQAVGSIPRPRAQLPAPIGDWGDRIGTSLATASTRARQSPIHYCAASRRGSCRSAGFTARPADAYGVIHTDLHSGNFMLEPESGRITLLDFDDCAHGWYAMDIAMCLHDFCVLSPAVDKDAFAGGFLRISCAAISAPTPWTLVWIERLPLFLKLLETGIYAQVAEYAASVEADSWVGRFMNGRIERITRGRPFVEIDFLKNSRKCAGGGLIFSILLNTSEYIQAKPDT